MTPPKVETKKQVTYTNSATAPQRTVSKTSVPLFSVKSTQNNELMGLQVEKKQPNTKNNNQIQEIYLQSGRKIVIEKLSDGRSVRKYYSADGKLLKPNYFKKIEGDVKVSSDGKSYTVTKDGQTKTYKTKTGAEVKIAQEQTRLNKEKKQQGIIGKSWDWMKNNVLTFCDSSDKAQTQLDTEKKLLKQIQSGKVSKKDFKEVTGLDCTQENIQKFKNGKLNLKSTEKINAYKEGQEMAVDVVGDVAAGIGAGIAIAAAPVTGGASLALATVVGGATKAGIKYLDAKSGGREYNTLAKDCVTGGIAGLLTPATMGAGGAVGNITTKFVGKFAGTKVTSLATFIAREGVVGGIYGGGMEGGTEAARQIRNSIKGERINVGKVLTTTAEGFGGGALAGILMSGGIKGAGKGIKFANKYTQKIKSVNFGQTNSLSNYNKKVLDETKSINIPYRIFKEGSLFVIEAKDGIVDFSKLGKFNTGGTIIRYSTPEQAKLGAINRIMMQFDKPVGQQKELCVAVKDCDLHLDYECFPDMATKPFIAFPNHHAKGEVDLFHNHPQFNSTGNTFPLSTTDILGTIMCENKSITAINKFGELCTITIKDLQKAFGNNSLLSAANIGETINKEFNILYRVHCKKESKFLLKLQKLDHTKKLSSKYKKRLQRFISRCEKNEFTNDMDKYMIKHHPEEYATILNEVYKKVLSEFGIEYTTNFSNL